MAGRRLASGGKEGWRRQAAATAATPTPITDEAVDGLGDGAAGAGVAHAGALAIGECRCRHKAVAALLLAAVALRLGSCSVAHQLCLSGPLQPAGHEGQHEQGERPHRRAGAVHHRDSTWQGYVDGWYGEWDWELGEAATPGLKMGTRPPFPTGPSSCSSPGPIRRGCGSRGGVAAEGGEESCTPERPMRRYVAAAAAARRRTPATVACAHLHRLRSAAKAAAPRALSLE